VANLKCQSRTNPTSDNLLVEFEKPFSGNVIVTNFSGEIVLAISDISEKRTLDISIGKLPNGIYVLSGNSTTNTFPANSKFIIFR